MDEIISALLLILERPILTDFTTEVKCKNKSFCRDLRNFHPKFFWWTDSNPLFIISPCCSFAYKLNRHFTKHSLSHCKCRWSKQTMWDNGQCVWFCWACRSLHKSFRKDIPRKPTRDSNFPNSLNHSKHDWFLRVNHKVENNLCGCKRISCNQQ